MPIWFLVSLQLIKYQKDNIHKEGYLQSSLAPLFGVSTGVREDAIVSTQGFVPQSQNLDLKSIGACSTYPVLCTPKPEPGFEKYWCM